MPSPIKLVPLFALGSLASTVVQSIFFFASTDTNAYVGSVVATASGLTTYDIACTSGASACVTGESVCNLPSPPCIPHPNIPSHTGPNNRR